MSSYVGGNPSQERATEAIAASYVARRADAYYWWDKTECDVVAVVDGRQVGFEVKTGVGRWRPPWHLRKSYLLDRDKMPVYISAM